MNRLGQITYFIIVAVLLLLVFTGLIYLFAKDQTIEITTTGSPIPAMPAIQNFVQTCIELVGTKGVYHLAYHGGYVNPKGDILYGESGDGQRNHYYTMDTSLPYATKGEDLLLRPLPQIEQQLSRYVLVKLDECLDFSNFEAQGLEVLKPNLDFGYTGFDPANTRVSYASDPVQARANIQEDRVDLEVSYPILVRSRQGEALLSRGFTSLDFRLGRLHSITGAVLADAHDVSPYDLTQHCKKFGAPDGLINLYLEGGELYQDLGLFVVDAQPLETGFTPLRFQVGVLNENMTGVCVG